MYMVLTPSCDPEQVAVPGREKLVLFEEYFMPPPNGNLKEGREACAPLFLFPKKTWVGVEGLHTATAWCIRAELIQKLIIAIYFAWRDAGMDPVTIVAYFFFQLIGWFVLIVLLGIIVLSHPISLCIIGIKTDERIYESLVEGEVTGTSKPTTDEMETVNKFEDLMQDNTLNQDTVGRGVSGV